MTPMIAPTIQYQNVFQSADSTSLEVSLILGVILVSGLAVSISVKLYFDRSKNPNLLGLALIALPCALCGFFGASAVMQSFHPLYDASRDAMVQNVKDKYGATLEFDQISVEKNQSKLDGLDQPRLYPLTFPDGTKGNYTIRFDRNTSEPFVTDGGGSSPTAQELNQNAGK